MSNNQGQVVCEAVNVDSEGAFDVELPVGTYFIKASLHTFSGSFGRRCVSNQVLAEH